MLPVVDVSVALYCSLAMCLPIELDRVLIDKVVEDFEVIQAVAVRERDSEVAQDVAAHLNSFDKELASSESFHPTKMMMAMNRMGRYLDYLVAHLEIFLGFVAF